MEKFVNIIYKYLRIFDCRIEFIDKQDVKQEIRFAILTAKQDEVFKVAHRLVDNLIKDYGYSRKKGKDQFQKFYTETELSDLEQSIIEQIELFYQIQDHTAKETAKRFGFEHNNKIAKLLAKIFPKNKSNNLKK